MNKLLKNQIVNLLKITEKMLKIVYHLALFIDNNDNDMTFSGILFICALVVSFAGANKQYSLKKSCYSLIVSFTQVKNYIMLLAPISSFSFGFSVGSNLDISNVMCPLEENVAVVAEWRTRVGYVRALFKPHAVYN